MITFSNKGDFSKTLKFFDRLKEVTKKSDLDKYGARGIELLKNSTPKDSGKTAESWYYKIEHKNGSTVISWCNSNVNEGVNIAIIIQYGHGTNGGTYVQGTDYINPTMKPLFEEMANELWKEVIEV